MARPHASRQPQTEEEWSVVRTALRQAEGRIPEAAEALGINPRTLSRWLSSKPDVQKLAGELRALHGVPGRRTGIR